MKKTILVVLMAVMIATPCFAQEVEPEGMFSLEGTLWQALPTGVQILPFPGIWDTNGLQFVFYGDTGPSYIDMLAFSIFWQVRRGSLGAFHGWYFGILQPLGIGMVVQTDYVPFGYPPFLYWISIALLVKTNDNWVPPEFVSISPNKGEQGAILKDVSIRGLNTYFASGDCRVYFYGMGGQIISNIRPISDTEIKFDLRLEADAEIGFRSVDVSWEDGGIGKGQGRIGASDVFEVLPKTN